MTNELSEIRELLRDAIILSEKCKREIHTNTILTTLGARPYMHEFNRILQKLRPYIQSLKKIRTIQKPKDETEAEYTHFYREVLYEIDLSLSKLIECVHDKFPGLIIEKNKPKQLKGFISHGRSSEVLKKVEKFLRNLGIEPLIVEDQANLDQTTIDKVSHNLNEADFVIVLATGDDKDRLGSVRYPRQNVIHEIGMAQQTHSGKIIYFLETGTEFPSNISVKVWERFEKNNMENVFGRIVLELRSMDMLSTGYI